MLALVSCWFQFVRLGGRSGLSGWSIKCMMLDIVVLMLDMIGAMFIYVRVLGIVMGGHASLLRVHISA